MQLNPSLEAKTIFDQALDIPGDERDAFVDSACAGRPDIRIQVREMISAFESQTGPDQVPLFAFPTTVPAAPATWSFTGTDRFIVQRQLGMGAFGVVYQVWDREQDTRLAVKVLHTNNPEVLMRFKREFRYSVDLRHDNLVRLYELFSEGERWFYTMELVNGRTLVEHVRPEGNFLAERLGRVFIQLVDAVHFLHSARRLHRDLKPANVLVTPEGRVVVLDFGLLRLTDSSRDQTMTWAGTPAYMSPEQLRQEPLTPASDWYAVGLMLFEALTGTQYARLSSTQERLAALNSLPAPQPEGRTALLNVDLRCLCRSMLEEDPRSRPDGPTIVAALRDAVFAATITGQPEQTGVLAGRRAEGSRPFPDLTGADHAAFVGRTNILSALYSAFSQVQQETLRVVLIEGQSGIGKSATVRRFLSECVKLYPETLVLAGKCYEFESVPYKGVDALIDELAKYLSHLPEREVEAVLPRDVFLLPRLFPVLGGVSAIAKAPARRAVVPDVQELRYRTFAALRELLTRLGDRHPIVIWVDDLQWGDRDSSTFLAELCAPPQQPTLLLILTYRSEDAGSNATLRYLSQVLAAQEALGTWQHITIPPLSQDESRELMELLLPNRVDPASELVSKLLEEAHGHPFFLQELAASINSDQSTLVANTREVKLHALIQNRVAALGGFARQVLEYVCLAAQSLPVSVLFTVAHTSEDTERAGALPLLAEQKLVRIMGPPSSRRVEPFHDQIREAVVELLTAEDHRQRHARLAAKLSEDPTTEPQVLVTHYLEAGESDLARSAALEAAEAANGQLAFDRAADCYQIAIAAGVPDAHEPEVYRRMADALGKAGRGYDSANAYLASAKNDPASRIELRCMAADQFMRSGHIDQGRALVQELAAHLGVRTVGTPAQAVRGMAAGRLIARWRLLMLPRKPEPRKVSRETRDKLELLRTAGIVLTMADPVQSTYYQIQYVAAALKARDPVHLAAALAIEAGIRVATGTRNPQKSYALLDQARAIAQAAGDPNATGFVHLCRAYVDYLLGNVPEGIVHGQTAVDYLRERCTGVAWEVTAGHVLLFWSLCWAGRVERVRTLLPELLKEGAARGDVNVEVSLRLLSYTHYSYLANDSPQECLEQSRRALERWSKSGFHLQHYGALFTRAETYLYMGEYLRAHQEIEALWAEMSASFILRWKILRIMALFLRGRAALACWLRDPGDARLRAEIEGSAKGLEKIVSPWSPPTSSALHAGLTLGKGDVAGAIRLLETAYVGFEKIGLRAYAAAARYHCGVLRGGHEGQELREESFAHLHSQGVRNKEALLRMFLPGDWHGTARNRSLHT